MHKINSDGAAVVNYDLHWIPIDDKTQRGVKMMLISDQYGIGQISFYSPTDTYFTHWHPLPTFKKENK